MEHHRPRKHRGPGVWALVRDAYLAGEPAPKVAQRYDVGLANLRRKALTEGWTRRAHAHAADLAPAHTRGARPPPAPAMRARPPAPPPLPPFELPPGERLTPADLELVLDRALTHAARQLADGRGAEANASLKAITTLRDLYHDIRCAIGEDWREEEEEEEEDGLERFQS